MEEASEDLKYSKQPIFQFYIGYNIKIWSRPPKGVNLSNQNDNRIRKDGRTDGLNGHEDVVM